MKEKALIITAVKLIDTKRLGLARDLAKQIENTKVRFKILDLIRKIYVNAGDFHNATNIVELQESKLTNSELIKIATYQVEHHAGLYDEKISEIIATIPTGDLKYNILKKLSEIWFQPDRYTSASLNSIHSCESLFVNLVEYPEYDSIVDNIMHNMFNNFKTFGECTVAKYINLMKEGALKNKYEKKLMGCFLQSLINSYESRYYFKAKEISEKLNIKISQKLIISFLERDLGYFSGIIDIIKDVTNATTRDKYLKKYFKKALQVSNNKNELLAMACMLYEK